VTSEETGLRILKVPAPVRASVVASFRTAILSGRFRPGERLIEKDLCRLTGVSRTSVREALRQLETEGLIELVPNRGPIVASISIDQARKIYEVRGALEALAGELFARRATDQQLADLEAAVARIGAAYKAGNIEAILVEKDAFYDVLLQGAGNEIAASVLRMMQARISLLRRVSLGLSSRLGSSFKEIRAILKAANAREPEATSEACRLHVERATDAALSLMARETEPTPNSAGGVKRKGRKK